ncbi:hypothetical protein CDA63_16740 [Hymenobacter amundsenii]|uniref:Glycosyltransferase 2-like domain-containing protein n=1 Tax=Hymenobacter amundsenii TaxID=2006685 RepID=A0A246FHD0_9BACT|nr:glycosyltransferase [Hymenobacter amundsenii]OWP61947.1 hypothetical protein CDA63_16740 [Hymenobacter amundsenii]
MPPLVSVILPVYNQELYLAQTLDSVLAQDYPDFELLIHDDGSTDQSAAIIRRYAARDARIRASYGPNAGHAAVINELVALAQGEWCALLDADDLMLPERLRRQLAYHQTHPEVDASSCHSYYINKDGRRLSKQRYPGLLDPTDGPRARARGQYVQCAMTGLFMRRCVFEQSGGLDSRFWPSDDFEYFNRLVDQGYTLVIVPEILMEYRLHATAITMRQPLRTYDTIGYVMANLDHRQAGRPEVTFDSFMAVRNAQPWYTKLNRKRYNYAQLFFRNAGIDLMSGRRWRFGWQLAVSAVLAPLHLLLKIKRIAVK